MRLRTLFLSASIVLAQAVTAAPRSEPIHVVFGLEGTLIRFVRAEQGKDVASPGDRPVPMDGASELLASVLKIPGVKVSFFSTIKRQQTYQALKAIHLPDGRTALDIAHRVLSGEDTSFNGKKKDLRKILGDGEQLGRVLLVDNHKDATLIGQDKNLLWLGDNAELRGIPLDPAFAQDRTRLARARGLLDQILSLSQDFKIPISEASYRMQWIKGSDVHGGHAYRLETFSDKMLYQQGLRAFDESHTIHQPSGTCYRQVLNHLN